MCLNSRALPFIHRFGNLSETSTYYDYLDIKETARNILLKNRLKKIRIGSGIFVLLINVHTFQ